MIATFRTPPGFGSCASAVRRRIAGARPPPRPRAAAPPRKLRREDPVATRDSAMARASLCDRLGGRDRLEKRLAPVEHCLDPPSDAPARPGPVGRHLGGELSLPRVPDPL